jgi:hypothetical protein
VGHHCRKLPPIQAMTATRLVERLCTLQLQAAPVGSSLRSKVAQGQNVKDLKLVRQRGALC